MTLDASDAQNRQLLEHLPEPVFVQVDDRIVYANPAAAQLLGATAPAALRGRSILAFAEPSQRDAIRQRMRVMVERRQPVERAEERYVRLDGTGTVHVSHTSIPFEYDGQPAILSIARDITERKRLEAIEARKIEVVGQLASQIAHDFRSLLLVILGNADLLLTEPANVQLVEMGAREIKDAARRGTALTRQLLFPNRKEALRPMNIELNDIVTREERILRRLVGSQVQLRVAMMPDAGVIHADPDQVGQVLVNLVTNARDAMPNGGVVTIETSMERFEPQDGAPSNGEELESGVYVTLAVRDTGIGMDEATRARMFEPFFTTKGDRGTGLGLASVADIVRESGATIRVESAPDKGSSFVISWPRAIIPADEH